MEASAATGGQEELEAKLLYLEAVIEELKLVRERCEGPNRSAPPPTK